jgi:autotransporter-associated beta strand protein
MAARRAIREIGLPVAVLLLTAGAAHAATYTWGVSSGDWSVPGNWGGTLPTPSDDAYITNGGTATVSTGGPACNNLLLGATAGSGALALTAGSLSAGTEWLGYSGLGVFTQSGGTNTASSLSLGYSSGGSGTYDLNGGVLIASAISGGSGTAAFSFGGGTLEAGGSFTTSLPMTFATNAVIATPIGCAPALRGRLSASGGFLKADGGRLDLSGTNTYSGGTTLAGGTLLLDFSVPGAPAANIINYLSDSSPLRLGGGTLAIKSPASGTAAAQRFNGLTLTADASTIQLNAGGNANRPTLSLGPITASTAGGTLLLDTSLGGTITTASSADATGIYGPRIVYYDGTSYDWAATTSAGSPYTLSRAATTTPLPASGSSATTNYLLTDSGSGVAANETVNTLKITTTTSGGSLAAGLGQLLTLASGGLLFTGSNDYTIGGGSLTAGNGSGAYELIVQQFAPNNNLTIASPIIDNGTNPTSLAKAGPGMLTLAGINNYSGGTSVLAGTCALTGSIRSSTVLVGGSGTASFTQSGGTNSISSVLYVGYGAGGAGCYSLNGTGSLSAPNERIGYSGGGSFAQSGGTMTVPYLCLGYSSGSNGAYTLSAGSLSITTTTGGLCVGGLSAGSTGSLTQSGGTISIGNFCGFNVGCGGSGTYTLTGGLLSGAPGSLGLSVGAGGTGTFIQSGGTHSLTNALYVGYESTGTYCLSGGQLAAPTEILGFLASGTFTQTGGTNAAGALDLDPSSGFLPGATYNLNGGVLVASSISSGVERAAFNFNGGTLTAAAAFSTSVPITLATSGGNGTINTAGYTLTLVGSLSGPGGLVETGSGTLVLGASNTYTGGTTVNGGLLSLTGSLNGAGPLALSRGTLTYAPGGPGITQAAAGLTVNAGLSGVNAASGNTLALGGIARNPGGAVDFNGNGGGTITTTQPNTNGILGPWATYGSGSSMMYARASGPSAPYTIAAYTGATPITSDASGMTDTTGAVNYTLSGGGGALAAAVSANTLQFTGGTNTVTASTANPISLNGIMNTGAGTAAINGGSLVIGSAQELVFTGPGNVTIGSAIQDNAAGPSALTMAGGGMLTLGGANSYSGVTLVTGGTLAVANSAALQNSRLDTSGAGSVSFGGLTAAALGGLQGAGRLVLANSALAPLALSIGGNASTTFSGSLSGSGSLAVVGSGALTLAGSNTYGGGTSVASGVLAAENPLAIPSGSLLSIGPSGSVVLGASGYAEVGLISGGGPLALLSPGETGVGGDGAFLNAPLSPCGRGVGGEGALLTGGASPVPEPATLLLLAAAMACGLAAWRRWKP